MHGGPPDLVWYVSYGSNLHRARFQSYLEGGRMPGGLRADTGCRDPSEPLADAALHLPFPLYFSGESRVWSGGVAFLDHDPHPDARRTYARGYVITGEQFEDVVAQESKRAHAAIDWKALRRDGRVAAGSGRYDLALVVGERDGLPMVTFTHPSAMAANALAAPVVGYLHMLAIGLRDAHGLDDAAVASYLCSHPGAVSAWNAPDLLAALAGWEATLPSPAATPDPPPLSH
ncbi:MAG: hypothetical protein JNK12_03190 [Acidimicrobiales bacterium]|nr:hypothetical protein [Acidimicrobiales bacterium]